MRAIQLESRRPEGKKGGWGRVSIYVNPTSSDPGRLGRGKKKKKREMALRPGGGSTGLKKPEEGEENGPKGFRTFSIEDSRTGGGEKEKGKVQNVVLKRLI